MQGVYSEYRVVCWYVYNIVRDFEESVTKMIRKGKTSLIYRAFLKKIAQGKKLPFLQQITCIILYIVYN
jgi:hypothetical protein